MSRRVEIEHTWAGRCTGEEFETVGRARVSKGRVDKIWACAVGSENGRPVFMAIWQRAPDRPWEGQLRRLDTDDHANSLFWSRVHEKRRKRYEKINFGAQPDGRDVPDFESGVAVEIAREGFSADGALFESLKQQKTAVRGGEDSISRAENLIEKLRLREGLRGMPLIVAEYKALLVGLEATADLSKDQDDASRARELLGELQTEMRDVLGV